MSRFKTNKSVGSDGCPTEWYRKLKSELSPLLLRVLNYEGKTPPSWKEAHRINSQEKQTKRCKL